MSRIKRDVDKFVTEKILEENFEDLMGDRFGRYSKYIIQERALPDARDGLKPVQRRILFAMFRLGLASNKPFKKSARVVGDVIGKYHPHGDTSVYEAMIHMSQDFKLRLPLIDMHGNNGSIDGDSAAAMRYTEARLSQYAELLLQDLNKKTVGFVPNFDDEELEPVVLPAKFPNLLVNGASGIAAGYATDIPPHNPVECIDAVIYRMQNKNCTVDDLLEIIKGPDFPTGAIIQGYEDLKAAYTTGVGKVTVKARCEISPNGNQIIITEIPYNVNKAQLLRQMSDQLELKKVDGVAMIRDETDKTGLRITIDIKKGFNAENILNFLLKTTKLQCNYNFNMVAIMRGKPTYMSLTDFLDAYIDHAREVMRNRCNFDLERATKRQEVVKGLISMVSILDAVIATIRSSKNKADAKENLISKYSFTELQAEAIVMLQLYRLTNTDIVALRQEAEDLKKEIITLNELLSSNSALNRAVIKELNQTKSAIESPRRTEVQREVEDVDVKTEDIIVKENCVLVITRDGYIKNLRKTIYYNWVDRVNAAKPKDKADAIAENKIKDDDMITDVYDCTTVDTLLMFSTNGNYAFLPIHKIPESKLKDLGYHVSTLINMEVDDKPIFSCVVPQEYFAEPLDEKLPKKYILIGTKTGNIKRMDISSLKVTRYSTIIKATKLLTDDDRVVGVDISSDPTDYVVVGSHEGFISIYPQDQVSVYQQSSVGVIGMRMETRPGDYLIGAKFVNKRDVALVLTNRGNIKRFNFEDLFKHDQETGEIVPVKRGNIGDYKLKKVKSAPHYAVNLNVINGGNAKANLPISIYCDNKQSFPIDFLTLKDAKDGNGKTYIKDESINPLAIVIERNNLDIN